MEKEYVDSETMLRCSFELARSVFDSGYMPDVIVALWRGGAPVAMVIHEFFLYKHMPVELEVVKAVSYRGIDRRTEVVIERLDSLLNKLRADQRILIVDDIFDSGMTMKQILSGLAPRVADARTAVVYRRPERNIVGIEPDYFVRETDRWVVFPHEIVGLSAEEVMRKGEGISSLLGTADGSAATCP